MTKGSDTSKNLPIFFFFGLVFFSVIVFLSGCGSSDSDPLNSGVFIDSAVQGLDYQSGSKVGVTNEDGKFYYTDKDSVVFSLGGLSIGTSLSPETLMTPIDLVESSFVTHPAVTNICRLLQSLDDDGDPSNGITITEAVREEIESLDTSNIKFEDDYETFEATVEGILSTVLYNGELVSAEDAQNHLFSSMAEENITPVVMINIGDGYTNGTQGGFGNVHQYTQITGFAAYLNYQMSDACDLVWENPLLDIDQTEYSENESRFFYRIENSKDDFENDEEYVPYFLPTNLGVDGATVQSLISEKTDISSDSYNLLNELMLPIPEADHQNEPVSQLDAAVYVASQYPNRLKLYTVWIGAEDTLGAVTGDNSTHLTEVEIEAYLNDASAGRDNIEGNLHTIIERLKDTDYAYIFVATLPHVETIGALYGKADIEVMATFDGAAVTALPDGALIGYNALIDKDGSIGTSIADALDTDNATLNDAIAQTLLDDANYLDADEIALINNKITDINNAINALPSDPQFEDANIYIVDLKTAVFDKLVTDGIDIVNADGDESYTVYKTFGTDKGFYCPDGYYPSLVGSAIIANAFFDVINHPKGENDETTIGIALDAYDIVTDILPVDAYNIDSDEDGFVVTPGYMGTSYTIPQYDEEQIGGWIDCDDTDAEVVPNFVEAGSCD